MLNRLLALLLLSLPAYADLELAPFPFATLVDQGQEPSRPRTFVLSAVENSRREAAFERSVEVTAQRRYATYEVPMDADMSKLRAHYRDQLGARLLFQCQGRDCGRSNTWANKIYAQALLYGRDQEQTYFAAQMEGSLVSVYLIKRGNRRQYAHVEIWQPERMPQIATLAEDADLWQAWLTAFSRTGYAVIPEVKPSLTGDLDTAGLAVLASLAKALPQDLEPDLQLVCHIYPAKNASSAPQQDVVESLDAASRCAQLAADVFAEQNKVLAAHGVGPLAPDGSRARSRLVLVAPSRLTR